MDYKKKIEKGINLKLKEFRKEIKKDPKEMAELLNVSKWTYYKIEKGTRPPSYELMKRFKQNFKVSIDEVFFN
jgi:DNA-binding XRE family transcriptional regulator